MTTKTQSLAPHNEAFIDGQNLHFGTTHSDPSWKVDVVKFRTYLRRKFGVKRAYYFLGCFDDNLQTMYTGLQDAGYTLVLRKHQREVVSHKKGNVDTDLVFYIMYKLYKHEDIDKVILVSGDGDYYRMVKFLRDEGKLGKIIFPARKNASTLYKQIEPKYTMYLDENGVKSKIAYSKQQKKEGFSLGS